MINWVETSTHSTIGLVHRFQLKHEHMIGMSEHPSASQYKKFIHTIKNIRDNVECVFLIKNLDWLFFDRLETFNKKSKLSCKFSFQNNEIFHNEISFPSMISMILEKMFNRWYWKKCLKKERNFLFEIEPICFIGW